jgi:CheY-like chemotaxis protein
LESASGPAIRYGDALIPLLRLDELLGEPATIAAPSAEEAGERLLIIKRGRELYACSGTHRHFEREVVLKSTGRFFAGNRLISAAVPLADGTLALVLSVNELFTRPRTSQAALAAAKTTRRKTVLVVDDSPVVRDLLAEALRAHGLRVLEAQDGADALTHLASGHAVDLVVTDVDMPRLDGIGLLHELRRRDGPRRLPIVIVSMRGSEQDQRRALDAGADAYLAKTDLSHSGLWAMLARFLE